MFRKGLIDQRQQHAGLSFRRLHFVFFGSVDAKISQLNYQPGGVVVDHDQEWLNKKNKHYRFIADILREQSLFELVANLCIYQRLPAYFRHHIKASIQQQHVISEQMNRYVSQVQEGLNLIADAMGYR